jgi:hypothetical protein
MRQLIRLKEGRTAKVKDIPGFLTQCIASKVGNPVYCQQGGQPAAYHYSPARKSYTVKNPFDITFPSRDVTYQNLPGQE